MPKTFVAQNVVSVNPLRFIWKDAELVQILVACEVNYGELGMTHEVDILPDLTEAQVTRAKQLYVFIRQKVEAAFLSAEAA